IRPPSRFFALIVPPAADFGFGPLPPNPPTTNDHLPTTVYHPPSPKPMLRLRVFQHVPHQDLGSLASVFAARGAAIAYTRFFAGGTPPVLRDFDMLGVLGGPMNVDEDDKYPWLAAERDALRAAL